MNILILGATGFIGGRLDPNPVAQSGAGGSKRGHRPAAGLFQPLPHLVRLGFPAFFAVLGILLLMLTKPTLF